MLQTTIVRKESYMEYNKEYSVFISFATSDAVLAQHLFGLFQDLRETAYFAVENLETTSGGEEWRNNVINGLKSSQCFLPIYTPRSVNRKWVVFETGMAEAYGLKKFPSRSASLSISEIDYLSTSVQVYNLFDKKSLLNLVTSICRVRQPKANKESIKKLFDQSSHVEAIIELSKRRWAFVAGSALGQQELMRNPLRWADSLDDYQEAIVRFVRKLSLKFLEHGYDVMSSPQVKHVGNIVSAAYISYKANYPNTDREYKIGGLHSITTSEDKYVDANWAEYIHGFRVNYLSDVEFVVFIGGGLGTEEEYEAAKSLDKKCFFIPFFGGSAKSYWEKQNPEARLFSDWRDDEQPYSAEIVFECIQELLHAT